jgi:hypothetical protein
MLVCICHLVTAAIVMLAIPGDGVVNKGFGHCTAADGIDQWH